MRIEATTTTTVSARALEERLEALRASPGYRNYQRVRDRVLEMKTPGERREGVPAEPSAYWTEELSNFEYMFDASPLIIDQLRRHTYHVTGLRVYDYRTGRQRPRERFAEKLRALVAEGSRDLLVPESRLLGGFGFDIDGQLYNLDTLKFFEALIALDRGGVLDDFRSGRERRLVWEIGAGWGGFAYQFKTVCSNVTYVIVDFPELFLFSATYLMTLFPDARVRFWGEHQGGPEGPPLRTYEGGPEGLFENWQDYDFIFVPHFALADMRPDRVDLTVNMVSFQEMTAAQVETYVRRAHELKSAFLYSLNREKSSYNDEIESVSAIISKYYWPRHVPVLPVGYTKMLDEKPSPHEYKHLVGWRRVKV